MTDPLTPAPEPSQEREIRNTLAAVEVVLRVLVGRVRELRAAIEERHGSGPPVVQIKDFPFAGTHCSAPDGCPVCSR